MQQYIGGQKHVSYPEKQLSPACQAIKQQPQICANQPQISTFPRVSPYTHRRFGHFGHPKTHLQHDPQRPPSATSWSCSRNSWRPFVPNGRFLAAALPVHGFSGPRLPGRGSVFLSGQVACNENNPGAGLPNFGAKDGSFCRVLKDRRREKADNRSESWRLSKESSGHVPGRSPPSSPPLPCLGAVFC